MKRVASIQSCYIPWRGYFDVIALVDEFILLDEVQYTKRDWRSRNRIKTPDGVKWLTIPVQVKGRYHQRIDEVTIAEQGWAEKHWRTLQHSYASAPWFDRYAEPVRALFEQGAGLKRLSEINRLFLEGLLPLLGIDTPLSWSTGYPSSGSKTERLATLCEAAGAGEYVSGPAARDYLNEQEFASRGISVRWMDYEGYPDYPQRYPPFDPALSIVDLLFNVGADAPRYMKHIGSQEQIRPRP
jgi:WbqC-like protein